MATAVGTSRVLPCDLSQPLWHMARSTPSLSTMYVCRFFSCTIPGISGSTATLGLSVSDITARNASRIRGSRSSVAAGSVGSTGLLLWRRTGC